MKKSLFLGLLMAIVVSALAAVAGGCGGSNADTVSENLSKEAEKFNVQRRIVAVNAITDEPLFQVDGKCSIEGNGLGGLNALLVICKHSANDYRKHYIGVPDNVAFVSTQLGGLDVSEYRTKIIFRPESLVPDFDLVTGDTP